MVNGRLSRDIQMDAGFFLIPGSATSCFGVANFDSKFWMRISRENYLTFPTLFGYPLRPVESVRVGALGPLSTSECKHAGVHLRRDYVIGETAQAFSALPGLIRTVKPVEKGHVKDWEAMYRILFDAWESVEPYKPLSFSDFSLIVAEPCDAQVKEREEMTSFVFEVMEVKSLCATSNAFFKWVYKPSDPKHEWPQMHEKIECYDDSGKWTCTMKMGHTCCVKWEEKKASPELAEQWPSFVENHREAVMEGAFRSLRKCKKLREALTITREQYLEYGPVAIRYVGI